MRYFGYGIAVISATYDSWVLGPLGVSINSPTLSIKFAQEPYIIGSLRPKPLGAKGRGL